MYVCIYLHVCMYVFCVQVDAPCMLRKGLPRAFPGLAEIKEKSRKEGTQYRSRVFRAPQTLMNGKVDMWVCVCVCYTCVYVCVL